MNTYNHHRIIENAVDRINKSKLDKLVITDSIPLREGVVSDKIDVISLVPLFARIIESLEEGKSLFETHQGFIDDVMKKRPL